MGDYNYPDLTKEEYIAELHEVLSEIEPYKVRFFYVFILEKLGIEPKRGVDNERNLR